MFLATGIRRSELAGIRYDPGEPPWSDLNLPGREIRVRGKARPRIVKVSYDAARTLDRYLLGADLTVLGPKVGMVMSLSGPVNAARG